MIFAVSSNSETACFDCGKTESNSLAQSSSVDVGDVVLLADPSI